MPVLISPVSMTSDTSPSPYVASATSELSGWEAYWLFDGGGWQGTTGVPQDITLDLGAGNEAALDSYHVQAYSSHAAQMSRNWTIRGSTDGVTYTTLDTRTGETAWSAGEVRIYTPTSPSVTAFRYYRMSITANGDGGSATVIGWLFLYGVGTGPPVLLDQTITFPLRIASQSIAIDESNGTEPLTWSMLSGTLPAGVSITSDGHVAGTAALADVGGAWSALVQVTDSLARSATATITLHVTQLVFTYVPGTAGNPADGIVGQQWRAVIRVNVPSPFSSQYPAPFSFSVFDGSLPDGLHFMASPRAAYLGIEGVPTTPGTSTFRVLITLSNGNIGVSGTATITVRAAQADGMLLPPAWPGRSYSFQFSGSDLFPLLTPPLSFAINDGSGTNRDIPHNLYLDGDGLFHSDQVHTLGIEQRPFSTGIYQQVSYYSILARSPVFPFDSAEITAALCIVEESPAPLDAGGHPVASFHFTGYLGVPFDVQLTAGDDPDYLSTGGVHIGPPYFWNAVAGFFVSGLSMDASGHITGTPTAVDSSNALVWIFDSTGFTIAGSNGISVSVTVLADNPLRADCNNPPSTFRVGQPFTHTFTASGGTPPYTFYVETGSLPPGLVLDPATGVVSGTPTKAGLYPFTVAVTDSTFTGTIHCTQMIPDSAIAYLGWLCLAKIYSDNSELRDVQKAAYCAARGAEGISLFRAIMEEEMESDLE